ncbi:Eukaryotic translation initiation factor 3 subunit A [Camellia lanceoleosa]|uniref:Eukaryotic translation initiation factor 3 subunit A n=1 Tax=Camellia lanceoleosa TaxID=1840588 RepID=A0ACC0H970_9ERIC|nr:Eukaryotic translation initiation factor 3 subunit A [Camellia lanceoleosa]
MAVVVLVEEKNKRRDLKDFELIKARSEGFKEHLIQIWGFRIRYVGYGEGPCSIHLCCLHSRCDDRRKKMVKSAKECIKQQGSNSEIYGRMQAVFIETDTTPDHAVAKELKNLKDAVMKSEDGRSKDGNDLEKHIDAHLPVRVNEQRHLLPKLFHSHYLQELDAPEYEEIAGNQNRSQSMPFKEAFCSVEDIHGLMCMVKKTPKASLMVVYYAKLTEIFWVSGSHLYHAYAWFKLFSLQKSFNKNLSQKDLQLIASSVVLAALSVAPYDNTRGASHLELEHEKEQNLRMANLIGFIIDPKLESREVLSRSSLLTELLEPFVQVVPICSRLLNQGDTFPLGCAFDESIVHHKYFEYNLDSKNSTYSTKNGIYLEGCGLDNVFDPGQICRVAVNSAVEFFMMIAKAVWGLDHGEEGRVVVETVVKSIRPK